MLQQIGGGSGINRVCHHLRLSLVMCLRPIRFSGQADGLSLTQASQSGFVGPSATVNASNKSEHPRLATRLRHSRSRNAHG